MERKDEFEVGEFYHIYNRGVEKRNIFLNDSDRYRFLRSMYFCNDERPAINSYRGGDKQASQLCEVRPRTVKTIVEIHAFVLMDNHFHFLIREKVKGGLTKFMRKLLTGYTMYFNKKHRRVGHLFQNVFKAVLVSDDSQLEYLPYYIHANPLDYVDKKWRSGESSKSKESIDFISNYKWSSHLDYTGVKNYPSLIKMGFMTDILGKPLEYKRNFKEWIADQASDVDANLLLE